MHCMSVYMCCIMVDSAMRRHISVINDSSLIDVHSQFICIVK
jgi:hypothetical protein